MPLDSARKGPGNHTAIAPVKAVFNGTAGGGLLVAWGVSTAVRPTRTGGKPTAASCDGDAAPQRATQACFYQLYC